MARVPHYIPQVPKKPAQPEVSSLRRMLAGGTRMGAGVLATEGGIPGALIAGAGEGLAELLEGSSPDIKRIGLEAGLGAIPFRSIVKAGKPVVSMIRSAALSGTGETGRELARGEDLNPKSILTTTAIGGLFGNVFGRLGGKAPEAPTGPAPYEVIPTSSTSRAPRPIYPTPEAPPPPVDARTAYWAKQGKTPPGAGTAAPYQELENALGGRVPYSPPEPAPYRAAAKAGIAAEAKAARAEEKAEIAAAKAAEEDDAAAQIAAAREGLIPRTPRVSESISAKIPGGRERMSTSYKAPAKTKGGGFADPLQPRRPGGVVDFEASSTQAPVGTSGINAPAASGAEQAFQSWIKSVGLGDTPGTRRTFPWGKFGGKPRVPAPPVEPPVVVPPSPATSPLEQVLTPKTAKAPAIPTRTLKQQAQQDSYDALAAKLLGKTPPQTSPVDPFKNPYPELNLPGTRFEQLFNMMHGDEPIPYRNGRAPAEPPAEPYPTPKTPAPAEPERALARFFKTRVDAAGQASRDIKAAKAAGELVPEEGRAAAGQALRREAQAAGLPTGKGKVAPTAPSLPVEPPVASEAPVRTDLINPISSPSGLSQTSKAREAALVARQAKREANKPLVGQALADFFRGKGRDDLAEQVEGRAPKLGSEKGAASPEFLARLGMAGAGALAGGVVGGSAGHPFLGMAVGAGAGALGPSAIISGLKTLGVPHAEAETAGELIKTPEGIKAAAHRFISVLPQVQRFNLLADAWGLPANMWAGPYGSAMMAGLEAHLSGDPRGMEVLKKLTPGRFWNEWKNARDEAKSLIEHGELGRMEGGTTAGGRFGHIMQLPGIGMTAGDVAARKILVEARFSEEEARRITLTSEPELDATKTLANYSKKSELLQLLQPFARTPANIAEQGAHRIPGLGFLTQSYRDTPDSLKQQLVQQGLGLGVGAGSYALGNSLDPQTARIARRFVSNLGGQYSLPASIGFGAGQAHQAGQPVLSARTVSEISNSLPLPTTAPISGWASAATTGRPAKGPFPSALIDMFYPAKSAATPMAPRMGRMPRLGGR